jgi:iron complex outermembrane receptor protein
MSSSFVSFRRHPLALACAGLALVGSFGAAAQDSAPTPTGLDTITVTAEHREQNLQEVPVSVGVVQGERMRDFTAGGDDTLLALSGRVPSLYAETTTGRIFPRFYIRGLGNIDFYLGASQPVSIIQDDVVLENVVLKSNPVYDVDQVEVLRGPQGSLFGRNTTAGIVKFDTLKPTQDYTGRVSASYATYNSVDRRRLRRPDQRHRLVPRVGPVPAPRRLRRQHLQGPERRRHGQPEEERHGRLR